MCYLCLWTPVTHVSGLYRERARVRARSVEKRKEVEKLLLAKPSPNPLPEGEGFLPNWICINKPELKYEKADFLNFARNRFLWLLLGTHASAKAKESRSAGDSDSQCDLVDDHAWRFAKH